MTRADFYEFFLEALDRAAENAERALRRPISRTFKVELHGPGHSGSLLDPADAVEVLYLAHDRFFKVIDVAVIAIAAERTTAFVRVSGHPPCGFTETWDPRDLGPFKQILSTTIRDTDA